MPSGKIPLWALLPVFFVFLCLWCVPGNLLASKIPGLEQALRSARGKEKVAIYNKLADQYRAEDPGKAMELYHSALELSRRTGYPEGEADTYLKMGYTFNEWLNDPENAQSSFEKSLKISRESGYIKGKVKANIGLAVLHRKLGNYKRSLSYFFEAEKFCRRLDDNRVELKTISCFIGLTYLNLRDFQRALTHFNRGLELAKALEQRDSEARFYLYIGNVFRDEGEYGKALEYYRRSLEIFRELGLEDWTQVLKFNLGVTYGDLNQPDTALRYLLEVEKKKGKLIEEEDIFKLWFQVGEQYLTKKKYIQADRYFRKALDGPDIPGHRLLRKKLHLKYALLCYDTGRYREAYGFLQKHIEIKDVIMDIEKRKKIAELQEQYDAEIREKEIEILKKDKKIQLILFAAGILLVLAILVYIFKKYLYLFAFWKKKNQVGHYRVMEKIASGGMGTVYKAHDIQDKTRELALKVLREEYFSDEAYKKRFKHEALLADQLSHPNIVKVMERGEADENFYIAMELLEGDNLAEVLEKEGRLNIPLALHIMVQTADALVAIHKKKIIHRDLKPENIMIIETADNPYLVKVLDFGLAKQQTLTRMTQTGVIMGSVSYLAPERITHSELTIASDIYSLGVIYYQVLSGEMLFFGDTLVDIAQQILEKEPLPLGKLRKDVPRDLERLIAGMLAKEPGDRPSAPEVLDALKKLTPSFPLAN